MKTVSNKNYIKGVRKERALVNEFREKDCLAFRSAGSHSPIDVVIINKKERRIFFVQCKPKGYPLSKAEKLLQEQNDLFGNYDVEFKIV